MKVKLLLIAIISIIVIFILSQIPLVDGVTSVVPGWNASVSAPLFFINSIVCWFVVMVAGYYIIFQKKLDNKTIRLYLTLSLPFIVCLIGTIVAANTMEGERQLAILAIVPILFILFIVFLIGQFIFIIRVARLLFKKSIS